MARCARAPASCAPRRSTRRGRADTSTARCSTRCGSPRTRRGAPSASTRRSPTRPTVRWRWPVPRPRSRGWPPRSPHRQPASARRRRLRRGPRRGRVPGRGAARGAQPHLTSRIRAVRRPRRCPGARWQARMVALSAGARRVGSPARGGTHRHGDDEAACRICAGDLSLRVVGTNGHIPVAEAFAPSLHETGRHGDLLECLECGTVQQPMLPGGDELHDLYREMRDDAYLGEEAGPARDRGAPARPHRRARRRRAPARRRLRARAAARRGAHARLRDASASSSRARRRATRATRSASTSASCRSRTSPTPTGFDVVVLADVHRAPRRPGRRDRPLRRAAAPRRRAVRRHAGPVVGDGARWPGGAGGATCPRTRACCRAGRCASCSPRAGSSSRPTSRSCARSRRGAGSAGLAERLGPARAPARARSPARLPAGASLSLSLGDERVVLAHRIDVRARAAAAAARPRRPRDGRTSSCPPTRRRARSPTSWPRCPSTAADRALLVDDASARRDDRPSRSRTASTSCATRRNRGYGAQPEDRLRARAARRRRRDRHGPRRQPVRPGARGRDGRSRSSPAAPTWSSARACSTTARSPAACRAGSGSATGC